MTLGPGREPPTGTKRHYWRLDPDLSDDELQAWAEHFVDAVLGEAVASLVSSMNAGVDFAAGGRRRIGSAASRKVCESD